MPATATTSPSARAGRSWPRVWLSGWAALCQLVLDLVVAAPYLAVIGVLIAGVFTIPAFLVGLPLVALALLLAFAAAYVERARLLAFTGVAVGAPPGRRGDQPWWRRLLLDPRPWKSLLHMLLISLWGLVAGTAVLAVVSATVATASLPLYRPLLPDGEVHVPLLGELSEAQVHLMVSASVVLLLVVPLIAAALVTVDVTLARWLLGPGESEQVAQLAQRVQTLTRTREQAVDSVEVERRRIERDLHDGPQQRLVSLAMDLGMARERMDADPTAARELLDKAHDSAKEAITEMRQVARGIHPPVLTDRGLDAALSALAARSPVPVGVQVAVTPRPSPTVEAIAYFCVSEALTNVAKHARARSAQVEVVRRGDQLLVRVSDDGVGDARPGLGSGLTGLRDRVRSVDGQLEVSSPPGGPTVLSVWLPCATPVHSQNPCARTDTGRRP